MSCVKTHNKGVGLSACACVCVCVAFGSAARDVFADCALVQKKRRRLFACVSCTEGYMSGS